MASSMEFPHTSNDRNDENGIENQRDHNVVTLHHAVDNDSMCTMRDLTANLEQNCEFLSGDSTTGTIEPVVDNINNNNALVGTADHLESLTEQPIPVQVQPQNTAINVPVPAKPQRKSERVRRPRSYSPEGDLLTSKQRKRPRKNPNPIKTMRSKNSSEPAAPFCCDLCRSPYITNPSTTRKLSKVRRGDYTPSPRHKVDPITQKVLTLCNACGLSFDRQREPRPKKHKPEPSPEEKKKYLEESEKFAKSLVEGLGDSDAIRLSCPHFKSKPCSCMQKYIVNEGDMEESRRRAQELLQLVKDSKKLSKQKCYDEATTMGPNGKPKKVKNIGLGNGQRRSKEFEQFVLIKRKYLREQLKFCERATQRVLMYSNNFLHKKLKTDPDKGVRAERQKGKAALGQMIPFESIVNQRCCIDNCVHMARTHLYLLESWRKRAVNSQNEARRVLAEMLTPSGGSRQNCYKFISWVTGCSHSTIGRVNDQMKRTGGNREPPPHGLKKYWQENPRRNKLNKSAKKSASKTQSTHTAIASPGSADSLATAITLSSPQLTQAQLTEQQEQLQNLERQLQLQQQQLQKQQQIIQLQIQHIQQQQHQTQQQATVQQQQQQQQQVFVHQIQQPSNDQNISLQNVTQSIAQLLQQQQQQQQREQQQQETPPDDQSSQPPPPSYSLSIALQQANQTAPQQQVEQQPVSTPTPTPSGTPTPTQTQTQAQTALIIQAIQNQLLASLANQSGSTTNAQDVVGDHQNDATNQAMTISQALTSQNLTIHQPSVEQAMIPSNIIQVTQSGIGQQDLITTQSLNIAQQNTHVITQQNTHDQHPADQTPHTQASLQTHPNLSTLNTGNAQPLSPVTQRLTQQIHVPTSQQLTHAQTTAVPEFSPTQEQQIGQLLQQSTDPASSLQGATILTSDTLNSAAIEIANHMTVNTSTIPISMAMLTPSSQQ